MRVLSHAIHWQACIPAFKVDLKDKNQHGKTKWWQIDWEWKVLWIIGITENDNELLKWYTKVFSSAAKNAKKTPKNQKI